jgi:formate dehydrogenase alpha subunit
MCPTGALSTKNTRFVGSPERESDSICGFCGVGCKLALGSADERIIEVNPAHLPQTVNGATLCVRGHFAHDYLNSDARLISPMLRRIGEDKKEKLVPVSWEAALDSVAGRLKEIKRENGPQSIAFLGSSKCSNEENYLFQKIARALIGTNNVDNGGYIFGQSLLKVFDEKTDGGYRPNPLSDLSKAQVILVLGADPGHSTPVAGYYLKRAARRGIPLIVVDPRQTELTAFASMWLPVKPGTDLELLNGLAVMLHEKKAYDPKFIDRYTEGFSLFRYGLSSQDPDRISRLTALDKGVLNAVADLLKDRKIAVVIGHGVLQQDNGMHTLGAVLNLSLMSGSLGVAGAGLYILAKESNQAGAMDMGATPDSLPGRQPLGENTGRKKWEKNWKTNLSPDSGLNMVRMIEAAEKGSLKALFVMGENPLRALPERDRVRKALQKLDFLVVQDIIDNETVEIADAVLPGAALSEKQGSVTNLEGRIQSFSPVVHPPGKARADWEILDLLAARLGDGTSFKTIDDIRSEIRKFVPRYAALDGRDEAWIEATSAKALFKSKGAGRAISFYPVVSTTDKPADDAYPFTAIVGTQRYQLGSGTRTGASERIQAFESAGSLEIAPPDAAALELNDGDRIVVRSRFGTVIRPIRLEKGLSARCLFIPTGTNENDAMGLFSLSDLTVPGAAGWKTCGVNIEKA